MNVVSPGPDRIAPSSSPDGVVVHVYAVPTEELLVERRLQHDDAVDVAGRADSLLAWTLANAVGVDGVCLVAYDGDTGERMDWRAPTE